MPTHDWTRFEAGDFHHFRQSWVRAIGSGLNRGLLPACYIAMSGQAPGRSTPDVVTPEAREANEGAEGGIVRMERIIYARPADRVAIRHGREKVVAIIEMLSPGNKESRHAIRSFVEKAADILNQGVNLLVDLFPPMPAIPRASTRQSGTISATSRSTRAPARVDD